jgi:hypothetical protein
MLKVPVFTGRLAPYRFNLDPKAGGIGLPPASFVYRRPEESGQFDHFPSSVFRGDAIQDYWLPQRWRPKGPMCPERSSEHVHGNYT